MCQAQICGLNITSVLGIAFVLVCTILTVDGLHCYQCNSTLKNNCQEMWDESLSTNSEKYGPCNLEDAKFCVKVTGLWGGVVGSFRFCSSRDMGYQCQDIWFPDHDRLYRACVYTCSRDGCNAAARLPVSLAPLLVLACLVAALQRWCWRVV